MPDARRLAVPLLAALALSACAGRPARPPAAAVTTVPPATPADTALAQILEQTMDGLDKAAYGAVSAAQSDGRVLLTGAVVRPDYRRHLELTVSTLPGVIAVTDAVQVVDAPSLPQYAPDGAKERDIVQHYDLPGLAVRVINGVVFLVGEAKDQDEIETLKSGLADDASVKWVDASAVVYSPRM